MLGQYRLGVKLHSFDGQAPVSNTHNFIDATIVIFGPGGQLEAIRQALPGDYQ
jgi:hypothetical protein